MAKLQRQTYINDIVNRLSGLAYNVELRGLLNLLDLHVISEDFYVGLLNLIYGWKLRNANSLQQNIPGIDLVDESNHILVQVTGTSTKRKIDHSLKEISEKYTGYHFYFAPIVIDAKEQRKHKYAPPHEVVFNPKTDILDIHFIVDRIKGMSDIESIGIIAMFIKSNIQNDVPDTTQLTSGLNYIISQLAKDDLNECDVDMTEFEIEAKISFNNLSIYAKDAIDQYKIYYINVQNIYSEYARQGKTKSMAVLQKLHKIYVSLKSQASGDALFIAIKNEIINQIDNKNNNLSQEQLEMCVEMLMVHAFMECKIFEKPI
ncbi:MAG: SMEK domain-containing protein [Prevotella sp.]|nr:SMEK domain-containing protein [Prevotella sp.]